MIVQHNNALGPRVARRPWDPAIIGRHRLTISNAEWDNQYEVEMSLGSEFGKGYWEEDCTDPSTAPSSVLWTQSASGGCWPFGVIVRNRGNAGPAARSIGLAHLAYKREDEAHLMGIIFGQDPIKASPEDVYITVMLLAEFGSQQEISQIEQAAFKAFETGFGTMLASHQKILVLTTTVNAAVSKDGYFGELSNDDVSALKNSSEAAAYTKERACTAIL
jgi:hypothetical protein